MAVFIPGKLVYLANPRTASVATRDTLMQIEGAQLAGAHHATLAEVEGYEGESVGATVRNPYDVLVSWFLQLPEPTLAMFLREYDHYPFLGGDPPDLFWQCASATRVLRWENLQQDLDAWFTELGIRPLKLVRENVTESKNRPWVDYYDAEAIQAANERFGHIVDKWGYERIRV